MNMIFRTSMVNLCTVIGVVLMSCSMINLGESMGSLQGLTLRLILVCLAYDCITAYIRILMIGSADK